MAADKDIILEDGVPHLFTVDEKTIVAYQATRLGTTGSFSIEFWDGEFTGGTNPIPDTSDPNSNWYPFETISNSGDSSEGGTFLSLYYLCRATVTGISGAKLRLRHLNRVAR